LAFGRQSCVVARNLDHPCGAYWGKEPDLPSEEERRKDDVNRNIPHDDAEHAVALGRRHH
jgi:hypothetical protein